MKKLIFIICGLLITSNVYAVKPDVRWCDKAGNCADITASGQLRVSATNSPGTPLGSIKPDSRLSDNDGDVADITAGGALRIA